MDSPVSPKDEIWFLHVCHHISTGLYNIHLCSAQNGGRHVQTAQISALHRYFPVTTETGSTCCHFHISQLHHCGSKQLSCAERISIQHASFIRRDSNFMYVKAASYLSLVITIRVFAGLRNKNWCHLVTARRHLLCFDRPELSDYILRTRLSLTHQTSEIQNLCDNNSVRHGKDQHVFKYAV